MLHDNDELQDILSTEINVWRWVSEDVDLCDESILISDDTINKLNSFDVEAMNQWSLHSVLKKSDCSESVEKDWNKIHIKKAE